MRRWVCLSLTLFALPAQGQVWEKLLAPGLTYRMEVDHNIPRQIHALRWSPKAKAVMAKAELGGGTVFESGEDQGRETISEMVRRTGAIGGMNADFFPWTGDPLGLMVKDGELLSQPYPTRSTFAWGMEGYVEVAIPEITCSIDGAAPLPVPHFNEEVAIDKIGLFSDKAGQARTKQPASHVLLNIKQGSWKVGSMVVLEVVGPFDAPGKIPEGKAVFSGTGSQASVAASLRPGQTLTVKLGINGFDWGKCSQAVAGGPNLVHKGLITIDADGQKFGPDMVGKRHPRSAVGTTADGDIWFVTIDGRQKLSAGANMDELARVMQRLGCMEAMNLDGGGSTTLNLFGLTVNRPSDGKERPVANAILFFGTPPAAASGLSVVAPGIVPVNSVTYLRVMDDKGRVIPNREVIWSATGSGWIDQGGFLRAQAAGTIFVSAYVRGATVAAGIQITG